MSKKKYKKSPGKPPVEPAKKNNSGFARSFAQMLFIVLGTLASLYTIYLSLTPKDGDTINAHITANMPRLMMTEWILYSIIAAGFVYCAFKWVFNGKKKIYDFVVFGAVFIAINGLFGLSFDKDIGSFGDNAQYIVHSKAMLEKGGPYNLYSPTEDYKARAPIGFPMMLMPITATYGMDVIKMKKLVFLMGSLSLVLFFFAFRKMSERYMAALIVILIGTYPMIIYNTSYIMTEVPFIFSISLALFCAMKLKEAESKRSMAIWIGLTVFSTFFTFMTRAVGVSMIAGVSAWLFFQVPWISIFKRQSSWRSATVVKFVVVTGLLAFCTILLQVQSSAKVKKDVARIAALQADKLDVEAGEEVATVELANKASQSVQFLTSDFRGRFNTNIKKVGTLWSQQILSKDLSRWYLSLGKAANLKKFDGAQRFFNFLLLISFLVGLIRRDLIAFIFLFLVFVTLAGTSTPVLIVYSRYFIPFVPFIIYLMARFLIDIANWAHKKRPMPILPAIGTFATAVFLFMIMHNNFSGTAYNTQRQNAGDAYTLAFDNYIKSAQWVKDNITEEDAIVASRKPRLFYVFSEKQGVFTVTYSNMTYSAEVENERIEYFKDRQVDYIILDAFSTASRKVILPIIQNNPDKFQIIQSVGEKYPSYVIKFNG